jgi:plasmid stabilization system protein ParE
VPRLVFAPRALDDVDRLADFLRGSSPDLATSTAPIIVDGLQVLKTHPLMGRPVERGMREALISRGRSGYVALYDYDASTDTVVILAIRHQREAGFE